MNRREFFIATGIAPAVVMQRNRPGVPYGLQIGDVMNGRATIWSRSDRPARLLVETSTTERFQNVRRVRGPEVGAATDFTGRVNLSGLPRGQRVFCRVRFEDLSNPRYTSDPVTASFQTDPGARRDIRFFWSGDTAGQKFGINPDFGGMKIYETMRKLRPDFFLHSGDNIYADEPIPSEVRLQDGSIWKNITTEAKSKVAETLEEFRGNYIYNLMDENIRRFNAETAQVWQWDDHEVMNNWSPGIDLASKSEYKEKNIQTISRRARQAFLEYSPIRFEPGSPRIYRRIDYGPHLQVFAIDLRSYRGPNTFNRQAQPGPDTDYLGRTQMQWLESELRSSRATWKVIACDLPIGIEVSDGRDSQDRQRFENSANGDGPPLGRELELAGLFRFIKQNRIHNIVWLTADVHYTAAHYYDPSKAQFTDFEPFWEFISGPLHAGTFRPPARDNTFGIQVKFEKAPEVGQANLPPSAGLQFFGEVAIEGRTGVMKVHLRDITGAILFTQELQPAR